MGLIAAEKISKDYQVGEIRLQALKEVSFTIEPASFVSFVGPSGSGKTTLLNLIGCLDKPTDFGEKPNHYRLKFRLRFYF